MVVPGGIDGFAGESLTDVLADGFVDELDVFGANSEHPTVARRGSKIIPAKAALCWPEVLKARRALKRRGSVISTSE